MGSDFDRVRVRVAPSPTGAPHVGTAYIALFDYAFARHTGGDFILRIEDTDRERSTTESEQHIMGALHWLGLDYDEGPDVGGPCGPYRQSERSDIYREHADQLLAKGAAYRCFCTPQRLAEVRRTQQAQKGFLGYDGHCRDEDPWKTQPPFTVRLKAPGEGETTYDDLVRGTITFRNAEIDDQVLLKSDGFPTYHLANVVDDHLMGISHVIRAEEWLKSVPKHTRLYQAFGWDEPLFCHLPLLRNADRSKISKRKNPVSLNHYRRAGFLPEALLNYLALMGWSMPDEREVFSLDDFVEHLDLERISLGGPVFDLDKLTWLNGRYLRGLSPEAWLAQVRENVLGEEYLLKIFPLVRERVDTLADFMDYAHFFFVGDVSYDEGALKALVAKDRTPAETAKTLRLLLEEQLDPILDWRAERIEAALRAFCEARDQKPKQLFMSVRVAVTGRAATPPLFETMAVLGREVCRRRLRRASEVLRTAKT